MSDVRSQSAHRSQRSGNPPRLGGALGAVDVQTVLARSGVWLLAVTVVKVTSLDVFVS